MKIRPLLSLALLLSACNSAQSVNTPEQTPATAASTGVANEQQAATVATRYFRSLPDSAVYQLPTMQVVDAGPRWQVLVKRSDRANIMPNNSAIEIDKQTGVISTVAVK